MSYGSAPDRTTGHVRVIPLAKRLQTAPQQRGEGSLASAILS